MMMKKIKLVTAVAGVASVLSLGAMQGEAADFVPSNEIRQINHVLVGGVETDVILSIDSSLDVGEQVIPLPLGENGATFELYADEEGLATPTLVDTKFIGEYGPKASFDIVIEDSWKSVAVDTINGVNIERDIYRTRADRAYIANVVVSNFSQNVSDPQAAKEVMMSHMGLNGDLATHQIAADANKYDLNGGTVVVTGSGAGISSKQTLTGPRLVGDWGISPTATAVQLKEQRLGDEYVTIKTFADTVTPSWDVGRAIIKVWPRMTADFNQLNNGTQEPFAQGQKFEGTVRDIIVHYNNIYPGTYAYVQIYPGAQKEGTAGWPIQITMQDTYDNETPQDSDDRGYQIEHSTLEPYITRWGGGKYTLEVINAGLPFTGISELNLAPLAAERISYMEFEVKQGIIIRGNIGSK